MDKQSSNYTGSRRTAQAVQKEILKRWGHEEAQNYDPFTNCLTFRQWSNMGYKVKKGEKSIRSRTFVEKKDENGNIIRTYPKTIHLFYCLQVEVVNS